MRIQGGGGICKPSREASAGTSPTDTLSLDFQPPELRESTCLSHMIYGTLGWPPKFPNTAVDKKNLDLNVPSTLNNIKVFHFQNPPLNSSTLAIK